MNTIYLRLHSLGRACFLRDIFILQILLIPKTLIEKHAKETLSFFRR